MRENPTPLVQGSRKEEWFIMAGICVQRGECKGRGSKLVLMDMVGTTLLFVTYQNFFCSKHVLSS